MPPRHHALFAILHHQVAQRVDQVRPQILEPLVVGAKRLLGQRVLQVRGRRAIDAGRHTSRATCHRRATCAVQARGTTCGESAIGG
ncbi:MAG TPA: hypothetical protein VNZ56_14950 [Verrucomicrobiae bacterium]|nr:hypothetical protein [Verrucomicrobiae bacterium]